MANEETPTENPMEAIRESVAKRRTSFMTELAAQEQERLTQDWLSRIEKALEPGDFKALMLFIHDIEERLAKAEAAEAAKGSEDELRARVHQLEKENRKLQTELLGR